MPDFASAHSIQVASRQKFRRQKSCRFASAHSIQVASLLKIAIDQHTELCLSTLYTGCIGSGIYDHCTRLPLPQHTLYRLHLKLTDEVLEFDNFASAHSIQVASAKIHSAAANEL